MVLRDSVQVIKVVHHRAARLRLHRRLQPFRRLQLRLRGRMRQSMTEHEAVFKALEAGDGERASAAIRDHVAVQGKKFHHLIANLKPAVS